MVTGGGAGIGRGIATAMAAFGAALAISERDVDSCAAASESLGALGIVTDVRDSEQVDAALKRTSAELGPVTTLVNNAGGAFFSPLLDTTENGWDALYKTNLRHVLLCTQRVARQLVAARLPGSIINLRSIEGVRFAPGYAAYAAAKAGVINYTKTAAFELAPQGIRVNALAPDITTTEWLMRLSAEGLSPDIGNAIPMGRLGHVDDIAGAAGVSRHRYGELHHGTDDSRRRRNAGRRRVVPPSANGGLQVRARVAGYFRQLPASIGSVTPVM